jgi:hypothetical protein
MSGSYPVSADAPPVAPASACLAASANNIAREVVRDHAHIARGKRLREVTEGRYEQAG